MSRVLPLFLALVWLLPPVPALAGGPLDVVCHWISRLLPPERGIRELPLSRLRDLRPRAHFGSGTKARYEGRVGRERVNVKVVGNRVPGTARYEAYWYQRLDRLGIGPRFFGLTRLPEGEAIVTAYKEGLHLKLGGSTLCCESDDIDEIPADFKVSRRVVARLAEMGRLLKRDGIGFVFDVQIIVSHDEVTLIDPESFSSHGDPDQPHTDPIWALQRMAAGLEPYIDDMR